MSRVDVLAVMDELAGKIWRANDSDQILALADEARAAVAEVFAAAHSSLAARDLEDQMTADDRLRAALAACEPETPHEPN
ncbi:hypothetical protein [Stenotrophomonas maltophilia]|uniref:hypothetical protein n=1 Tax=Stenotrophomonas maltophilia TaxID=40324 RepID=UPI000B41C567|nr:hypothetical protein [Stenotrophomonas maltophilia]OWB46502.1 hypothetical protein B7H27_10215 [Stenotrophomonas maltophilia]